MAQTVVEDGFETRILRISEKFPVRRKFNFESRAIRKRCCGIDLKPFEIFVRKGDMMFQLGRAEKAEVSENHHMS